MQHSDRLNASSATAVAGWLVCVAIGTAQAAVPLPVPQTTPTTANRPRDAVPAASEGDTRSGPEANPDRPEGLWPSKKLLRLVLTRFVDDACTRYDLDDEQREAVRDKTVDRWTELLTERRAELEPLFNDYLEMRLGLEPPDAEQVKAWSDRAATAFGTGREQIEKTWDDFRDVLTPRQRPRFEMETLAARAALDMAAEKLRRWRKGSFAMSEVWEPREPTARRQARKERRQRRAERRKRINTEAETARGDQVDQELDSWEQYVADFIERYRLDEGQRTTALSLLAEIKARASAHRDRHSDEIAAMERHIANPSDDESDRESIKRELVRLYGPIDELFSELERRLEPIPTEAQRIAAGRIEQRTEAAPIPSTRDAPKSSPVSRDTKPITAPSRSDGKN